jgi:hypothetical protein
MPARFILNFKKVSIGERKTSSYTWTQSERRSLNTIAIYKILCARVRAIYFAKKEKKMINEKK